MCGIAGFFSRKGESEATDILERMLGRIKYRGPDESGIYLSPDAGLGSVRLSIVDLRTGSMPLSNEDGSMWIVYNGEIFNYIELRERMIKLGHIFKTSGDTEVILHMYEEYGAGCLDMLNGDFAFAIWDVKKKELFLARDRVGIRPLFYTSTADGFVFASEIKAIFEYPGVKPQISARSLSQVFTFWTTLTPHTLFEDVFEVRPGYCLTINAGGIHHHKYWELPIYKPGEYNGSGLDRSIEEFDELFSDAVRLRMRSDVTVGAYLSGGIDSCATTSYIMNMSGDNLRTFSIGFTDKEFDELPYQKLAVDHFKTDHHRIDCSQDDIAEKFPETVWHAETALLRTAPVPMFLLSGLVNSHDIKVVITGEGADELLGGYNIFKEASIRQFWAREPKSKYRPLLLRKLYPYLPHLRSMNSIGLKLFFGYRLGETASPVYSHLLRWHNTSRIQNYFSEGAKAQLSSYDPVNEFVDRYGGKLEGAGLLSRAQWIEMNLFMSGYLLSSQGDRVAMAHSLEGRYPFLDHRIIDFCMKLPPDHKLRGLNEKYLLKKLMNGKLPPQIVERSKQPYRAPVSGCFISENSPAYVEDMFSEESISASGFFDFTKVSVLLDRLKSGVHVSEIDNMALTGILSTQLLYSFFVDKSFAPSIGSERVKPDRIIVERALSEPVVENK